MLISEGREELPDGSTPDKRACRTVEENSKRSKSASLIWERKFRSSMQKSRAELPTFGRMNAIHAIGASTATTDLFPRKWIKNESVSQILPSGRPQLVYADDV